MKIYSFIQKLKNVLINSNVLINYDWKEKNIEEIGKLLILLINLIN